MKTKIEKFQVEELEQRFETGRWVSSVKTGVIYKDQDIKVEANVLWDV